MIKSIRRILNKLKFTNLCQGQSQVCYRDSTAQSLPMDRLAQGKHTPCSEMVLMIQPQQAAWAKCSTWKSTSRWNKYLTLPVLLLTLALTLNSWHLRNRVWYLDLSMTYSNESNEALLAWLFIALFYKYTTRSCMTSYKMCSLSTLYRSERTKSRGFMLKDCPNTLLKMRATVWFY